MIFSQGWASHRFISPDPVAQDLRVGVASEMIQDAVEEDPDAGAEFVPEILRAPAGAGTPDQLLEDPGVSVLLPGRAGGLRKGGRGWGGEGAGAVKVLHGELPGLVHVFYFWIDCESITRCGHRHPLKVLTIV